MYKKTQQQINLPIMKKTFTIQNPSNLSAAQAETIGTSVFGNFNRITLAVLKKISLPFFVLCFVLSANESFAQYNQITTVPPYGVNGTFGVTFNIKAYARKVIIRKLWTEMATTGSNTLQIYYKTDSISAAPNTGTQTWILATTVTFTSTASTTAIDSIPGLLNIEIPAGRTYGFWISNPLTSGGIYYRAPATGDTACRFDGNIHINMGVGVGYGGAVPIVVATPRQLCGRVEYEVIPSPANNASISAITSPASPFCAGNYPVKAVITNNGSNRIDSVRVRWTLDGVTQAPLNYNTPIDTSGHPTNSNSVEVTLASSVSFGAGVTRNIKIWTAYPNGVVDTVNIDDTATAVKHNAMSGVYTINPAGSGANNFTTFAASTTTLKNYGVCGPVVINVAPGTYNEKVELIGPIGGLSATNPITFEGTDPATRIINYNSTGITTAFHTVKLEGVQDFTFRNFTVNALGSDNAYGILIRGGGVNNVNIRKCIVNIPNMPTTPTSVNFCGIIATGVENNAFQGSQKVDSLHIDSNIVNNGYSGVVHFGAGGAQDLGCTYTKNIINNIYYYGMFLQYHDGCKIKNNIITMRPDNANSFSMNLAFLTGTAAAGRTEITENKLISIGGYGIYLSTSCTNLWYNKGLISNNMIGGLVRGTTPYGIFMNAANNTHWTLANNSINFDANNSSAAYSPLYIGAGPGISVLNNILSVSKTSLSLPLYIVTPSYIDSMDYNIFYRKDTSNNQLIYFGTTYNTGNFKGGGGFNFNSVYADPGFINDTNLHITSGCFKGMPLPYVTTDIDGLTRANPPSIGAHEYLPVTNDMAVMNVVSPVPPLSTGAQDLVVKVKNVGTNTVTAFNISYRLNGGTVVSKSWLGTLVVCDTVSVTFTGLQQVILTTANALKIYTSSPNFSTDNNRNNDTLNSVFLTPLSGVYTINPGGSGAANFTSFSAATNALNSYGVAGPVTFNVAAGTYNEAVTVGGTILGLTAATPITFDGGNGNASTRIITANVVTGATVTINQKNYIQFRNLTITNTNNGNPAAATIIGNTTSVNNGTGCAIKKCILNIPNVYNLGNTSAGLSITSATFAYSITTVYSDSIEIDSNIINGGFYGIGFYGASNSSYNRDIKFRGNIVYSSGYGIYTNYIYNPVDINYNNVNMYTISGGYAYYGIQLLSNTNSSTTVASNLTGNKVTGAQYYGIYISAPGGTSTAPMKIYNNMVSSATFNAYNCIYLNSTGYTEMYHNTLIYNFNSPTSSYGALYASGSTNLWVKNNIFGHEAAGTGGGSTPAYFASSPSGNQVNYNIYYNKTGTNLLYRNGFFNSSNFLSSTAGGDTSYNSILVYANAGANDFHLTNVCTQRGFNLTTSVPVDIDAETRAVPPQIGCDEYPGISLDLMIDALLQPSFPVVAGAQDVMVRVRNNGSVIITQFSIAYRINNGTPVIKSVTATLSPCDTTTVVFTGTQQITIVTNTNYAFKIYTYSPNSTVDGNRLNDTINTNVATPMVGTYTIGAVSSDYVSFNTAVAALQLRGVGGSVIFNVRTGTYNERLTVPAIIGASLTNNITFKSLANNRDSVIMNAAVSDPNILSLADACYVKFTKLTLQSTSITTVVNGINISGTSSYDSIVDCKILMAIQGSYTNYTIYATGLTSNNIGLVFKKNFIQGSYYGIYWFGSSTTNRPYNTVFDGNTIQSGFYSQFYYLYYSLNTKFINNTVIHNGTYPYNYSYFYYDDSLLFANNALSTGIGVTYPYWYLGYASNQVKVFNNSFNHASLMGSGNFPYLYNVSGYTGYEVKNNIFNCTGAGFAAYWSVMPTAAMSDYNLYYSATGTVLVSGPASPANLAAWKTACNCDKNSVSYRPGYTTATNLAPNISDSAVWALNGRGIHISGNSTDINGNPRPTAVAAGVPDIGAYEFTPTSTPPLATPSGAPTAGATQSFTFAGDTVAKVSWDPWLTPPSALFVRQWTSKPASIGSALYYMYFYNSLTPSNTGTFGYDLKLYYKDAWMGTMTNLPSSTLDGNLTVAQKATPTTSAWANVSTGSVDSVLNIVTGQYLTTFGWFTASDITYPVPVNLVDLNANIAGNNVLVNWITASEQNSDRYVVERSIDGTIFAAVGTVKAAGNSNTYQSYLFTDAGAKGLIGGGTLYYRLAMYDMDGHMEYSKVVSVSEKAEPQIALFPNPFNSQLVLNMNSNEAGNVNVVIVDINGKEQFNTNLAVAKGINTKVLEGFEGLSAGVYFARVCSDDSVKVIKLIKK